MLRLYADEDVLGLAVSRLRERGHDVVWAAEIAPGTPDRGVLQAAVASGRVLVSFDKDFGEWVFRTGAPAPSGVVLFRISTSNPEIAAARVVTALESRTDWAGHFSVVEHDRVRMVSLPQRPRTVASLRPARAITPRASQIDVRRRIIAIDWSGAADGGAKTIWTAETDLSTGVLIRLESGRTRDEVARWIINESQTRGPVFVGLDFAFAFPSWFMRSKGWASGPECWAAIDRNPDAFERWLAECPQPFWGRPGSSKPRNVELHRQCEMGLSAKSVFQVGGAGAVGTGSIRGIPILHRLREAGLHIWPFDTNRRDTPDQSVVVEIYPRLLTGPVTKSVFERRRHYLDRHFAGRLGALESAAASSEDAFDAAVSSLALFDLGAATQSLPTPEGEHARVEGLIWPTDLPARRESQ